MSNDKDLSDVLSSNYMLASLTVRTWSAQKTDKSATAELLADKGAASNAASVVKSLLAGNDKELKDTQAAYARIRTWFYANSLPWSADATLQRGDRLVGTEQAMTFLRDFANLKTQAEQSRDKFLEVYDSAVANAATALGQLYDAAQYPSKAEVEGLFGASLGIVPMPDVADFDRVSIPGHMAAGLKQQYEKRAEKYVEGAIIDAQRRLGAELTRMITQLDKVVNEEKPRLYKSLITNMETVAALAQSLGPVSPELDQIADAIHEKLLEHNVEAYKDNVALARSTSNAAQVILDDLCSLNKDEGKEAGVNSKTLADGKSAEYEAQQQADAPAITSDMDVNEVFNIEFDEDSVFGLG